MRINLSIFLAMLIVVSYLDRDLFAQSAPDLRFILNHREAIQLRAQIDNTEPAATSEVGLLAAGLLKVYQTVISSQDVAACNFIPSCSHFTAEAIRKAGPIRGTLLGADRLMRCHWFAPTLYSDEYGIICNGEMCRLHDPIERYLGGDE